jgi:hypothetical protein
METKVYNIWLCPQPKRCGSYQFVGAGQKCKIALVLSYLGNMKYEYLYE